MQTLIAEENEELKAEAENEILSIIRTISKSKYLTKILYLWSDGFTLSRVYLSGTYEQ